MTVTQVEVSPAWENFIDLQNDVKVWQQFPSSDTASDTKMQWVIDAACQWVQSYLGRPIAPTQFFRRFSGWSGMTGAYVQLPYYPVLSVQSVVEFWGSSGPHTLTEQTPASQGGQDCYQMDYLRGTVIRTFTGLVQRPWFPGSRNIEITWTAGYNPVPMQVKIATMELVKYWWVNTQQVSRSVQIRGGEYDAPEQSSMALWPAVPNRITAMLEVYEQVGIG